MDPLAIPADDHPALVACARLLLLAGDVHGARCAADRAVLLGADVGEACALRGEVAAALGEDAVAWQPGEHPLDDARARVERLVGSAVAWSHRGTLAWKAGLEEEAAVSWRRALRLDPRVAWAWHGLANQARDAGDRANAVRCYSRAVEVDPTCWASWVGLAHQHLERGRADLAAAAAERATVLAGEHPYVLHLTALLARARGDVAGALGRFAEALTAGAGDDQAAEIHSIVGTLYLDAGLLDAAAEAFEASVARDPAWSPGHLGRALVAERRGSSEVALAAAADALAAPRGREPGRFGGGVREEVQVLRRRLSHGLGP